ncbi:MAG: tRNA lysidine(34) synthetase TilS [Burkholderiales bacterium]
MTQTVDDALRAFAPALPLAVAFSGGADSTALLLACAARWPAQVLALHVNHGLQPAAVAFEQHCRALCARLNVPLLVQAVQAHPAPGQSPEDAARRARYQAFAALAQTEHGARPIQSIAIAQHADDQVETLLLALSRGAGLAGLSAMRATWQRDGLTYHRPLLSVGAAEIRRYLAERDVPFIEDPSNADEHFTRNRIRARIMPALQAAFPQFLDTFARSAAHAAQGQALLDEVAQQDRAQVCRASDGLLRIAPLRALSRARQANVLRHWLKDCYAVVPSAAQLAELLDQLQACSTRGHQIDIKVGPGFVRRQGEVLHWYNP